MTVISANNVYVTLAPCRVISTSNLSGTYFNGPINNGIGATLTESGVGALTIDSVTLAVNDRVLLQGQTTTAQNGVYVVTNTGSSNSSWILQRASDQQSVEQFKAGQTISISAGTTNAGSEYTLIESVPNIIGTSAISFVVSGLPLTGGTLSGGLTISSGNLTLSTGLVDESFADALTATGANQNNALALTREINRLTTVTSGTGVILPASVAGLSIIVINSGANALQVYGAGTDTINDVLTTTGVTQMVNSAVEYYCSVAGKWYTDGIGVGYAGSLATMSFSDGLVATGTMQSNALQLTTDLNRLITVNSSTGVILPIATAGLDIIVINHGANTVQIYGNGSDTIDDVAGATGVGQMVGSVTIYVCTTSSKWYSNGIGTGFSGALPTVSFQNTISAFNGGGQGSATPLTTVLNRITTVTNPNDSVLLPVSAGGLQITAINAGGGNSLNVFPRSGDTINALGANNPFALTLNKVATFYCVNAGNWHSILTS